MNILVTASTFPGADLDGSRPRFVYDLAESLSSHARVLALAPHHPGAATEERMGSVEVVRFRYWLPASAQRLTPNMRHQIRGSLLARLQVPLFFLSQVWSLRRLVERHRIDLVNAHWLVPQGLCAALVRGRRRPRFSLALHVHAGDVYLLRRIPLGRAVARFVVARSDHVFAAGSHVRNTLDDLVGWSTGARIQPMGVHRSLFEEPTGREPRADEGFPDGYVLFIGRLVEKKGVVHLLRAFPRLLERHPGLGLLLVGDGPDASPLREEVVRLGLMECVRFLGHRPHAEIVGLLAGCRAVAVPSVVDRYGETEGMPTVVTEAMAAGARVVGSAVNGIPDLIRHGENGWLCREKDSEDLAEKLLDALAEPPDSAVAGAARDTAARYDWPRVAADYLEALAT